MHFKNIKRKHFLVVVILICSYLLIAPLFPGIQSAIIPISKSDTPDYPVSYISANGDFQQGNSQEKIYLTDGNRLYIPKIGVDAKILEGQTLDVLSHEEGVWREPGTSTPDNQTLGNMTLAGHRFQYLPPNTTTFYNLDRLQAGDQIQVYWNGKAHFYEIYKTLEVNPDEVWILNPDENVPEITLYTCTPVYTSEKRLVVKAKEV